jgi:hypothetical protein
MNVYDSEKMLPDFVRLRTTPRTTYQHLRYAARSVLSTLLSKNLLSTIHKANSGLSLAKTRGVI